MLFRSANLSGQSFLFPGAMAAVEVLHSGGFAVGICTNKPEALAERLMRDLGARKAFASLVGADTLPVRKPDPAPLIEAVRRAGGRLERSLLVGDTVTDRETARAARVPSVLVTFGPTGQAVRDLAPEAVIDSFDQLAAVAEALLPL